MAIDDYTKAFRLDQENPLPLFYRGELRLDQGQTEVAIEDLERALKIPSGLDFIQFYGPAFLGDAHYLSFRFQEARTLYLDAASQFELAKGPADQAECLYKAGLYSLFMGETETAHEFFTAAIDLDQKLKEFPQPFPPIWFKASKEVAVGGSPQSSLQLNVQLSPSSSQSAESFLMSFNALAG